MVFDNHCKKSVYAVLMLFCFALQAHAQATGRIDSVAGTHVMAQKYGNTDHIVGSTLGSFAFDSVVTEDQYSSFLVHTNLWIASTDNLPNITTISFFPTRDMGALEAYVLLVKDGVPVYRSSGFSLYGTPGNWTTPQTLSLYISHWTLHFESTGNLHWDSNRGPIIPMAAGDVYTIDLVVYGDRSIVGGISQIKLDWEGAPPEQDAGGGPGGGGGDDGGSGGGGGGPPNNDPGDNGDDGPPATQPAPDPPTTEPSSDGTTCIDDLKALFAGKFPTFTNDLLSGNNFYKVDITIPIPNAEAKVFHLSTTPDPSWGPGAALDKLRQWCRSFTIILMIFAALRVVVLALRQW
jgi:hypothetical protein